MINNVTRLSSKTALRSTLLTRRQNLNRSFLTRASQQITERLFTLGDLKNKKYFSLYLPINKEVDTKLIINKLTLKNAKLYLPCFDKKIASYVMAKFKGYKNLIVGPYQIQQPNNIDVVDPKKIEVAILPGVGFSKEGVRLGYGKGVFDRLLKKSKAIKIGLAYEFQLIDSLQTEQHDLVMDFVVTERRVLDFRS